MICIAEKELDIGEKVSIYDDYDHIRQNDGIPQIGIKKYALVAEEGEKHIGYISGFNDYNWVMISNIWVAEEYRRQGIGSKLLKVFEAKIQADGFKHIWLWTYGHRNPLFYEKNGYTKFAVFDDFFGVKGYPQTGYRKDLQD